MTKEEISGYSYRVTQASRTQLIVIMYEATLNNLSDAIYHYEKENIEAFRINLKKAQRIINELSSSLDMNYDISTELFRLYLYFNNTMIKSSIRKEIEQIKSVMNMLEKLKIAFEKVSEQDNSGPVMRNSQKIFAGLTYSNGGLNEYNDQSSKRGFTV